MGSGPTWLSFDPGKTTGIASWNNNGTLRTKIKVKSDDLDTFLANMVEQHWQDKLTGTRWGKPKGFIYELFRVRRDKASKFAGSQHEEIQVIGKIKLTAKILGIPAIPSEPNNLKIAALWSGTRIPAQGHVPDDISAFLHGYHYLHTAGVIPHRVLENYQQ